MSTALKLTDLFSTKERTAVHAFNEKISFELRYISRAKFKQMTDQSVTSKYDQTKKAHVNTVDTKNLLALFVGASVVGWKGVTPRTIAEIAPLDLDNVTEDQLDVELPYSQEQLTALLEQAHDLDTFIQATAMDISCFANRASNIPADIVAKN